MYFDAMPVSEGKVKKDPKGYVQSSTIDVHRQMMKSRKQEFHDFKDAEVISLFRKLKEIIC